MILRSTVRSLLLLIALALISPPLAFAAGGGSGEAPYEGYSQLSHFPKPLSTYGDSEMKSVWEKISHRAKADPFNVAASLIFLVAILHTFASGMFRKWAHEEEERHHAQIIREQRTAAHKPHEGAEDDVSFKSTALHFLGEIEAVFGIWVMALIGAGIWFHSWDDVKNYLGHDVNFTEPLFVVVIMAIAASRPVLLFSEKCLEKVAGLMGKTVAAWWLSVLIVAPLLGSFITEPAAMTIAALILKRKLYPLQPSTSLAYATLGLLFVNISIGGTLTNFAAPPILMVATTWDWSSGVVLGNLGWKCAISIVMATAGYYFVFRKELERLEHVAHPEMDGGPPRWVERDDPVPAWVTVAHVGALVWTVLTSHYPPLFIGGFLFFMAFVQATGHHQNAIILRMPVLVGFFLAALVIHGGCQSWWIEPLLTSGIHPTALLFGSAALTAFNDNAAITYLASQAPGLTDYAKYVIVAGAVAGGGMTIIANAPNPAGQSILGRYFKGGISPAKLALGALPPTALTLVIVLVLKSALMHIQGA